MIKKFQYHRIINIIYAINAYLCKYMVYTTFDTFYRIILKNKLILTELHQ